MFAYTVLARLLGELVGRCFVGLWLDVVRVEHTRASTFSVNYLLGVMMYCRRRLALTRIYCVDFSPA